MEQVEMNAKINLDDIVNVFVSKFEDEAYAKRDKVQKELKSLKEARKASEKLAVQAAIDTFKSDKVLSFPAFSMQFVIKCGELSGENVVLNCLINLTAVGNVKFGSYSSPNEDSTYVNILQPIPPAVLKELEDFESKENVYVQDLMKINEELKTIGRKTRKLKGKLAEKKMNELGMKDLLNNEELLAIVNQE